MFDFNWSEIALIGVVALVLIGPKDMPVAIRAISNAIKKMRRMAGEFQHHVDDMLRDADLADVKSSFDEIRSMNLKGTMRRALDPDGAITRAFDDPFKAHPVAPVIVPNDQPVALAGPPAPAAPSFIPPEATPPAPIQPAPIQPGPIQPERAIPAFIPPGATTQHPADH